MDFVTHQSAVETPFKGDVPDAIEMNPFPFLDDDALTSQRNFTQSYGLYVSLGLKGEVPSPGEACRGNIEHEG